MTNPIKRALFTAGIATLSLLPINGTAQSMLFGSNKSKSQSEIKFGYDKKKLKQALKNTKFFDINGLGYNADRDHLALAKYLATDTVMLAALTEEFLLINEQLLNQDLKIGDTVLFVSDNQNIVDIPGIKHDPQAPVGTDIFFTAVVDKNNKNIIVQEKKDDALGFCPAKIRSGFYFSKVLNRKVYGEQMVSLIAGANKILSYRLNDFYLMQKQQEIIKKYGLQNRKIK